MKYKIKEYRVLSNLIYIFKKQWSNGKFSVLNQGIRAIAGVLVALIEIFIMKIILDSLELRLSIEVILSKVFPAILLYGIFSLLNYISEVSIKRFADYMRYSCFIKELNDMAIKQPYEIYTSPEGKSMRKKAEIAVGESGETGMNSFFTNITELSKNILGFIFYFSILICLNPYIVIFLMIGYLLDAFIANYVQKWVQRNKNEQALAKRKLNYMAYKIRTLTGAKDIQMYEMAKWLEGHSKEAIDNADEIYKKIGNKYLTRKSNEQLLTFLKNSVAYIYLIYLVLVEGITIGSFLAYFAIITGLGQWLNEIVDLCSKIVEASGYVEDYRRYIDYAVPSNATYSLNEISFPYTITFDDVCFKYPNSDKAIIDHISFKIKSGDKIAVVGNNGAGKTTLIKLLCGLLTPTSGKILLNGIDVKTINKSEYYQLFSAIFQEIGLLPTSIAKNIALCVNENIDENHVWKCLKIAGLDKKVKSLPKGIYTNLVKNVSDDGIELSKGELQKLLLARAVYKESSVMILDEPTAALDPIAENEVYQKYSEIVGARMAIFISHRLASTKFCDSILFLKDSRVMEHGNHEELMKLGGEYARLFKIQSQYYTKE